MSKGWDNIMLKKLKALTGKGLSTSEIGKRLGMSKNAIVGKLNRLGWNAKAGGAAVVAAPVDKKATAKKADKKTVATPKKVTTTKKETPAKKVATKVANVVAKPKKEVKTEKTTKVSATKTDSKNLAMHQRIIQHSLEMANLKPNQCRWPIGDPDSEHFHFCGETVFVGKPYCYEHCKQAYQFAPPKKK